MTLFICVGIIFNCTPKITRISFKNKPTEPQENIVNFFVNRLIFMIYNHFYND